MTENKKVVLEAIEKLNKEVNGVTYRLSGWDNEIDEHINPRTLKKKLYLDDTSVIEITKKQLLEVYFVNMEGSLIEIDMNFITPKNYKNKYGEEH